MFDRLDDLQLLRSMLIEAAKASNELKCAKADLDKAQSRLNFLIMLTNKLIERKGD